MHEFDHGRILVGKLLRGEEVEVRFVNPVAAVCLAAIRDNCSRLKLVGRAQGYARASGLEAAIATGEPQPKPNELLGVNYSPLTRLRLPLDVESCNTTINALFRNRLAEHGEALVGRICKVVGELHDNVTSHSRGSGFSAAQVYRRRLVFGIADSGCGILRAIRRAAPHIVEHGAAISWAFQKGNTGAVVSDSMAQRWEPGASDPYTDYGEELGNHHQGLGLWTLEQLVSDFGGALWLWSGDAVRRRDDRGWVELDPGTTWSGVVIALEIPLNPATDQAVGSYISDDEGLAEDLGL